jgi:hypothetical protein
MRGGTAVLADEARPRRAAWLAMIIVGALACGALVADHRAGILVSLSAFPAAGMLAAVVTGDVSSPGARTRLVVMIGLLAYAVGLPAMWIGTNHLEAWAPEDPTRWSGPFLAVAIAVFSIGFAFTIEKKTIESPPPRFR